MAAIMCQFHSSPNTPLQESVKTFAPSDTLGNGNVTMTMKNNGFWVVTPSSPVEAH
jgi:hypothetical protein